MKKRHIQHGYTGTKLYKVWENIKIRCYYEKARNYNDYGGRGIKMQEDWRYDFLKFKDYVTKLTSYNESNLGRRGLTIDRIDNNENYKEGNLMWSNYSTQQKNRRKFKNNKSGFVGVSYSKKDKKYVARITVNGVRIFLGLKLAPKDAYQLRLDYIKENNIKGYKS